MASCDLARPGLPSVGLLFRRLASALSGQDGVLAQVLGAGSGVAEESAPALAQLRGPAPGVGSRLTGF